jgi:molybdopterin converting factor small subunit
MSETSMRRMDSSVTTPTRKVGLFAGMAAAAGCREVEVAWPGGTAADLRAAVAAAVPAVAALVARSAVAVGTAYVADDEAVPDGAVAIIPPVSGG